MELTTRAFSDKAMKIILFGIKRTAQGVPLSAGVPDDRQPIVTILDDEPLMASEDFGLLGLEGKQIPIVMFWLGAMDPAKLAAVQAAGQTLPGPHTSRFEPVPEPTLRTCRT
jgi:hippurate hydrolase